MPKAAIPTEYEGLPVATAAFMRELDRLAGERGLGAETLMERAGKAVAQGVVDFLRVSPGVVPSGSCVVAAGRGANGGDGLVAARHLKALGVEAVVFMVPPKGTPAAYPPAVEKVLKLAKDSGVRVEPFERGTEAFKDALGRAAVILDALLGTGTTGKPAGPVHQMIQEITRSQKPVVSLDLPSGLDPDTGYHSGVFVTAALTLTIGLPKRGLLASHAKRYVGELKVLDIGYPPELVKQTGLNLR